jgi:hypothetical protein
MNNGLLIDVSEVLTDSIISAVSRHDDGGSNYL